MAIREKRMFLNNWSNFVSLRLSSDHIKEPMLIYLWHRYFYRYTHRSIDWIRSWNRNLKMKNLLKFESGMKLIKYYMLDNRYWAINGIRLCNDCCWCRKRYSWRRKMCMDLCSIYWRCQNWCMRSVSVRITMGIAMWEGRRC